MKHISMSQMKSWLLNAVYFSQFGCCNPEKYVNIIMDIHYNNGYVKFIKTILGKDLKL